MIRQHEQFVKSWFVVVDGMVVVLSWILAYYLRFYVGPLPVYKGIPSFSFYLALLLPLNVIWWGAALWLGLYRRVSIVPTSVQVARVFQVNLFALFLLIGLTFFIRTIEFSRLVFVYFFLISTVLVMVARYGLWQYFGSRRGKGWQHVVLVGEGRTVELLKTALAAHQERGVRLLAILAAREIDQLLPLLARERIDQVILAFPEQDRALLSQTLSSLETVLVDVVIVPDLPGPYLFCTTAELFEGIPLIAVRGTPLHGWRAVLKRVFDIIFASLVLFLTFPLLLTIAIAIKLTSHGPVLFTQPRMGLDGQLFNMLKFRTMQVAAQAAAPFALTSPDDPRCTWLGRYLRRFSLDELPQFLNVLRGEMSVVGPRPERPELIEQFKQQIPQYMLRHKVKSGVTGWAQVNGLRGDTSITRRIAYDLFYMEHWTFLFDLQIVLRTIPAVLLGKNAY